MVHRHTILFEIFGWSNKYDIFLCTWIFTRFLTTTFGIITVWIFHKCLVKTCRVQKDVNANSERISNHCAISLNSFYTMYYIYHHSGTNILYYVVSINRNLLENSCSILTLVLSKWKICTVFNLSWMSRLGDFISVKFQTVVFLS